MPNLSGSYDPLLVVISICVALLASYTAIGLASRVRAARSRVAARTWLLSGGAAMGVGIWSMHFIGMLALDLPVPLGYDLTITLASLGIAVALSVFALWAACRSTLPPRRLAWAACLMGAGVSAMHYVGMAALRIYPRVEYDGPLFAASIGIAVAASAVALWIFHRLTQARRQMAQLKLGAALLMGLGIVGMHYTGMAAANFPAEVACGAVADELSSGWLATSVTIGCLGVLLVALIVTVLDARMQEHTSRLAASLADANHELVQLALHDTLTRLPNRALLQERMEQAIAVRRKPGEPGFAVLFIDLDGFKAVNDLYGHEAGDELLSALAARGAAVMPPGDSLARIGGDEFVALAHAVSPDEAAERAQSLIDELSRPVLVQGQDMFVSASIGIAMFPSDGRDVRSLLKHADAAMYHAKRSGRAAFSFFEPSMNSDAQARILMLHALRGALAREEFELHFQPKFAAGGEVLGAEALLRWHHPERGLLAPEEFIGLAEGSGLIIPIGRWVLEGACRQLRAWHDQGRTDWTMAVNLSAAQFAHEGLAEDVEQVLQACALAPSALVLEITETTAMRDVQASLDVLSRLSELGVHISIDDFGTGYASLLHLKRLPASELKIDRAFIGQLEQAEEDFAIVSAIILLARKLKLRVVAEGVETEGQQRFLTELGCDSLQGFLLGRPVPATEFWQSMGVPGAGVTA